MIADLKRQFARVVRVHVAGDFYDEDYTQKWLEVIQELPHVQFFAYTRSWRVSDILPSLIQLAREPNMHLWWSIDRETGGAPFVPGVRVAYMAINDIDASLGMSDGE
jgi:hypothetical protein